MSQTKSTIKLACMAFRAALKLEFLGDASEMEKKLDLACRLEKEARALGDETTEYNLNWTALEG